MGIRVSELASELGMGGAELVSALGDLGVPVPGPAAIVDADTAQAMREMFGKQTDGARVVEMSSAATVKDLADAVGASAADVQKKLMAMGVLASINQRLGADVARKLASAYGVRLRPKLEPKAAAPAAPAKHKGPGGGPQSRPPVVTIMGHVDHGKTTLLDAIRHTNVVEGEFGGITQHIGAYQVDVDFEGEKRRITFLDTPGHAAFTAMRARGASVTDIAILVVAADDGIMPQTIEAIDHARAAEVPIIVAINKIDKPEAEPDRVKTQLTEYNLVPREYGGDIECVPVSAKTGQGVNDLLEHIAFQADVMELRADPYARPRGVIVEARQEVGRGPVATVLVQQGTLRVGDAVVCGLAHGRVRAMMNERGERLNKATPAMPVEILGLSVVPQAGDRLDEVKDERTARQSAEQRARTSRANRLATAQRVTLEDLYRRIREGETKELNLVVKADVQGSVEAVVGQLQQLPQDEVGVRVIHSGVGNIGENDIMLASASSAVVIGFNVRADQPAQAAAEREHIEVRTFHVIYELTESVERAMKGMLEPIYEEIALGKAEVRATFRTPRGVIIAGCYVTEGKIVRNAAVRVRRGRDVVYTSKVDSLKHLKDDAREIAQGFECGIVVADFADVQIGDVLEVFEQRQVER
ncbi:MAG: translation initiation factor IF-2 [Chthonomonadales bacterium]|nr:translation initiation factor IF-2 [Chthonomonadales bacterium]